VGYHRRRVRVLEPGRIGPLRLRNRVIKAATFEGMTPAGRPSDALVEHHRTLAAGGVGMTTVAYGAVAEGGRTFADQILLGPAVARDLRRLTDAVHREGAAASIQLVHCGGFRRIGAGGGARGPSFQLNLYGIATGVPFVKAMREAELEALPACWADAARTARDAGFDAVEIHLGHGYLLSQFLSPIFNRRRDRWGGDLEGRARLALRVVERVREAVPELAVIVKMNTTDGVRGGLELHEAATLAGWLGRAGVDAIEPSGGLTSRNAFFLLRGRAPLREMIAAEHHPIQRLALRTLGRWLVRSPAFSPMFFLEAARAIRDAVEIPVILLGGLVSRADLEQAREEGFAFVALGRALVADPDFVHRLARGEIDRTRCNACNACVAAMEAGGVRCVLDDPPGRGAPR
jgi:2,4-dienoyl-CoA reductase-like NADH-dependent reductase (Old Yellow Enzyme family)